MPKYLLVLIGASTAAILAACSVTTIDYHSMTAQQLAEKPEYMPTTLSVPAGKVVIGPVEATACQAALTDPVPDHNDAYLLLRREAALKGATAVAGVGSRVIATRTANCYTSVYAYGTAYVN